MFSRITLATLVALLTWGCTLTNVSTDQDKSVDFSQFHTYGWVTPDVQVGNHPLYDNDLIRKNIQGLIEEELQRHGLRYSPDHPDLLVGYHWYTEKKKEAVPDDSFNGGYNGGWGYYPYGYGNWPYQWNPGFHTVRYTEGTLIIDVINAKDNLLVWRGWDNSDIDDPSQVESELDIDVREILKKYPVKAMARRD